MLREIGKERNMTVKERFEAAKEVYRSVGVDARQAIEIFKTGPV